MPDVAALPGAGAGGHGSREKPVQPRRESRDWQCSAGWSVEQDSWWVVNILVMDLGSYSGEERRKEN